MIQNLFNHRFVGEKETERVAQKKFKNLSAAFQIFARHQIFPRKQNLDFDIRLELMLSIFLAKLLKY